MIKLPGLLADLDNLVEHLIFLPLAEFWQWITGMPPVRLGLLCMLAMVVLMMSSFASDFLNPKMELFIKLGEGLVAPCFIGMMWWFLRDIYKASKKPDFSPAKPDDMARLCRLMLLSVVCLTSYAAFTRNIEPDASAVGIICMWAAFYFLYIALPKEA